MNVETAQSTKMRNIIAAIKYNSAIAELVIILSLT